MTCKSFQAFVDRIEGDKAVLLVGDREQHQVVMPVACLPDGVSEGAVLTINLEYEPELTARAYSESEALLEQLRDRDEQNKSL